MRVALVLILSLFSLWLCFYLSPSNSWSPSFDMKPDSQIAPSKVPLKPSTLTSRPIKKFDVKFMPVLSSLNPQEELPHARKPEGNIVEFEIVNGWAVAYGDVLLGKPLEDFQGQRGRYDAPQPRTWENAEIPYIISPDLPQPERIEKALGYFRQNTPVRFVPYQNQKDGIIFESGQKDCYSFIGKIGGLQPIHLSPQCQPQQIMHELMHALGFVHEQSRSDREQFVEILWDDIQPEYHPQFAMVPESFFDIERDTPFDYHSIMLYPTQAFAKQPAKPTMRSLGSESISPVQDGLSDEDIRKIRQLYRR